ncbi:MAG: contact-dependent growth inhibition system immunity protein [Pseudomonadota bacterium]
MTDYEAFPPGPRLEPYKCAFAIRFRWFYWIESWVASSAGLGDPTLPRYRLPLDASPEELGAAVNQALAGSVFMQNTDPRGQALFRQLLKTDRATLDAPRLANAPVKTSASLYRGARGCGIYLKRDRITIEPTKRDGPDGWTPLPDSAATELAADVDEGALGRALMDCFERSR